MNFKFLIARIFQMRVIDGALAWPCFNPKELQAESAAGYARVQERNLVTLFSVLAALRLFIFCAAFPLFNNVDEAMHFDLVMKYARGDVPRGMEIVSPDSISYLALMNSPEYFKAPDQFPDRQIPPPPWTLSAEKRPLDLAARSEFWLRSANYESSQAPLYYGLAALWFHFGRGLGLHDGQLVFWLRFLNLALVMGLIRLGYKAAQLLFPDNSFLRLGVPALLAFMPQSAFYSIGNDTLSAVCFGAGFIFLIRWLRAERPSAGLGAAMGLAFAATYLAKLTNLPLLVVGAAAVLFRSCRDWQHGKLHEILPSLAAFLCCANPPIIAWVIWCKRHFGDATGVAVKAHYLGWTLKPFAQWWLHPIFSSAGLWTYLSEQMGAFWQGEFWWHGPPLCLAGTNAFYTLLSLGLIAAALPALFRSSNLTSIQRQALQLALACFLAGLGFFALMSVVYDFHDGVNPSSAHPYFTAGRLLLGALIPFLLLVVYGLNRLLGRLEQAWKFTALTVIISAMFILEIASDWPAFCSQYNWFHLP
jgi:hypothetical protein